MNRAGGKGCDYEDWDMDSHGEWGDADEVGQVEAMSIGGTVTLVDALADVEERLMRMSIN